MAQKPTYAELNQRVKKLEKESCEHNICANCKMIRDDKGYWNNLEVYIQRHLDAQFSHGICLDCAKKLYPDFIDS